MLISDFFLLITSVYIVILIIKLMFYEDNISYLSNKILLAIFFIFGFAFLRCLFINRIQVYHHVQFPIGVLVNSSIICAIPILFYLYVKTILLNQRNFIREDLYHLTVFIFFYVIFEFPYRKDPSMIKFINIEKIYWSTYFGANYYPDWVLFLKSLLGVSYSTLTYNLLHKKFKNKTPSKQLKKIKRWLFNITHLKFVLSISTLIMTILLLFFNKKNSIPIETSMIALSFFFSGLSFYLNRNKKMLYDIPIFMDVSSLSKKKIKDTINLNSLFKKLSHEIEANELYLKKEFSLKWLSSSLNIRTNHISLAISENGFENFSSYSNHFKIKKAKELIGENFLENYNIEALAAAAGFNAVTSFYRIFKAETGMTPKNYNINLK